MSGAALAGAATDTTTATGALSANPPILLDDPNHVNGSSNIGMGTGQNTQTGDNAAVAFPKLKQWAIDQNTNNARAFALLGGLTTEILTPGMTLAQLTTQYTAVNVPGFPQYVTSDAGLWKWNGAQWVQAAPHVLMQGGVPFILPPSGTMANNGALTVGTAFDTIYANAWMFLPANSIYTGQVAGTYFVRMSSTTVGQVFQQQYFAGDPVIPAPPTPFVCTGPGAYTQTSSAVTLPWVNIPANMLQNNGRLKIDTIWSNNNSAGSKNFKILWGGAGFQNTEVETTNTSHAFTNHLYARGPQNQISFFNATSESVAGGGIVYPTVNTAIQNALTIQVRTSTATDWMVIQSFAVEALPATLPDNPIPSYTPASALIVPPGAAANGFTVNKFFIKPKVSDVSFTNDVTKSLFPGSYYNTIPFQLGNPFGTGFVDTPGGLQLNYPGIVDSGSATGGSTTTLVDSSKSWVTNAFYGSQLINVTTGQVGTVTANNATTLTVTTMSSGNASTNSYAISGAGGNFNTETQNSVAGAIPYMVSANGWYVEAGITLTNNHYDHWPAFYMNPQEHDINQGTETTASISWASGLATVTTASAIPYLTIGQTFPTVIAGATPSGYNAGTATAPIIATVTGTNTFTYALVTNPGSSTTVPGTWLLGYLEIDIHEGGFVQGGVSSSYGMRSNIASWNATGSLTGNSTNYSWGSLDWTQQQVLGACYNPTLKQVTFWLNGAQVGGNGGSPFIFDTNATNTDTRINPFHYYILMGPQIHTAAGAAPGLGRYVPYGMTIGYMSGWSSV